jgi:hypothetical protein
MTIHPARPYPKYRARPGDVGMAENCNTWTWPQMEVLFGIRHVGWRWPKSTKKSRVKWTMSQRMKLLGLAIPTSIAEVVGLAVRAVVDKGLPHRAPDWVPASHYGVAHVRQVPPFRAVLRAFVAQVEAAISLEEHGAPEVVSDRAKRHRARA